MIEAKTLPLGTVAASMCNKHRIVNNYGNADDDGIPAPPPRAGRSVI